MTENRRRLLQLGLLIVTIITTTLAGAEWKWMRFLFWGEHTMSWADFQDGLAFSLPFLFILTCHEFGHYFTARYHQIKVSLPYYIPLWFGFLVVPSIGTMGAVIRIRESIISRIKYFDVGVSGPIAGFVVALGVLWYGFTHLPETDYIYEVHPEYELFGADFEQKMEGIDTTFLKTQLNPERYNHVLYKDVVQIGNYKHKKDTTVLTRTGTQFGDNLMMMAARELWAPDDRYVPTGKELMHYPWLLAGFLALFFTALNLLPIGQLDGGHVTFGLLGPVWHQRISNGVFMIMVFYSGLGLVSMDKMSGTYALGKIEFVILVVAYTLFLYSCAYSLFKNVNDRWLFAGIVLGIQFALSSFFKVEGYTAYLLFALILGRFIGIQHPQVQDNTPLTTGRKVLGWVAIVIFILCFTPKPLIVGI
jgi:membrane-associated protease RseP (regulator of RpoE activity)